MNSPILFADLLTQIESQDPGSWVYLPNNESWTTKSRSMVLRSLEVSPEEEDDPLAGLPPQAQDHALMRTLPVAVVQDIVSNARAQKSDATIEDLFSAFLYYYDHDAFVDFEKL